MWQPRTGKYEGQVNMHLPDAWGYVEFAPAGAPALGQSAEAAEAAAAEPRAQAGHAAMKAYYAMHAFKEATGRFAGGTVEELAARGLLGEVAVAELRVEADGDKFVAVAKHGGVEARVNEQRLCSYDQCS